MFSKTTNASPNSAAAASKSVSKRSKHAPGPKGEAVSFSFTITFSQVVENGTGMEQIGTMAEKGFTTKEFKEAIPNFEATGASVELKDLNKSLPDGLESFDDATVLIVHGAAEKCFEADPKKIRQELIHLNEKWDIQKLMRGKVKNSLARRNMCIADVGQAADIANGKGTIVAWSEMPELSKVRARLAEYLGCKAENLNAEGNFYHHETAGIGFHGDGERRIVVAMRFGHPLRLHYQAYHRSEPIGERVSIDDLVEGDLYVMGDKATGNDWKKSSIITWRHAAERFHMKRPKYVKSLVMLKEQRLKKKRKREAVKNNGSKKGRND